MQIFILRHGQAEPYRADDETRKLVEKGVEDVKRVVQQAATELSQVERVLSSPYIRARETATVALPYLPVSAFDLHDWLEPSASLINAIAQLEKLSSSAVLLVSHQPLVSKLIESLCGLPIGSVAMDTASLASIDVDPVARDLGKLNWIRHSYPC